MTQVDATLADDNGLNEEDEDANGPEDRCPACGSPEVAMVESREITGTYQSHEGCPGCGGFGRVPNFDEPLCMACAGDGFVFQRGHEDPVVCPGCGGLGRPSLACEKKPRTTTEVRAIALTFACSRCEARWEEVE